MDHRRDARFLLVCGYQDWERSNGLPRPSSRRSRDETYQGRLQWSGRDGLCDFQERQGAHREYVGQGERGVEGYL
jgi:hypothetical protein